MFLGVDIGGTKIAVAPVAADGALGPVVRRATPAQEGPDAVLAAVASAVAEASAGERVEAIGVGTAGVVDRERGRIVSATDSLARWAGTDVADRLQRLTGAPTFVLNDVDAHAVGEARVGAARGARGAVILAAVGTGVGGAVLVGGNPWPGAHHVAGEIGHIPAPGAEGLRCGCGRTGHLEGVASGPAIARLAGTDEARAAFLAAGAGDQSALSAIERAAQGLGRVLAGLATTLDPELIVIGGGVAEGGEIWWRALRSAYAAEVIAPLAGTPIVPAALGWQAALVGAGLWAREQQQSSKEQS